MGRDKPRPRPVPGQRPAIAASTSLQPSSTHAKIGVSFESYTGDRYGLHERNAEETRAFLACLRKLCERTWQQLIETTSKNPADKTGLNPTTYAKGSFRNRDIWPAHLGTELTMIGIRSSEKHRIFGIRRQQIFYILWFVHDHKITKE